MDDTTTITASTLDQADEEILTYTVSDETLEAAAGTEMERYSVRPHTCGFYACTAPGACLHRD